MVSFNPFSFVILLLISSISILSHSQYNFIDGPYLTKHQTSLFTNQYLSNFIAPLLNTTYLNQIQSTNKHKVNINDKTLSSDQNKEETKIIKGIIDPNSKYPFISLPVRLHRSKCNKTFNVIFLININVQHSILSYQTFKTLYQACNLQYQSQWGSYVRINQRQIQVAQLFWSKSKYTTTTSAVNILGTKFLKQYSAQLTFQNSSIQLIFQDLQENQQDQL